MKFLIINLKKYSYTFIFMLFTLCLLMFSNENLLAAKKSLELFINTIIPSLFPFMVAAELLAKSNFTYLASKILEKPLKKLFNLPGQSMLVILLGYISGYPISAKTLCYLKSKNMLSKVDCEKLLTFTNNSGPFFILATIGLVLYKSLAFGIILLVSHIFSSITIGIFYKHYKKNLNDIYYNNKNSTKLIKSNDLGEILMTSIQNSIKSCLLVGGYIIFFSSLLTCLESIKLIDFLCFSLNKIRIPFDISKGFIYGLIEVTNGVYFISDLKINTNLKLLITSFLLGFGGMSIFFQIFSIISKENLSIKLYLKGKILQAFLSTLYTFFLLFVYNFI